MCHFMMTGVMALAAFGAMVATAQAENQTPSSPTVSGPVKKRTDRTPHAPQAKRAASKATFNSYDVSAKKALDLGFIAGQAGRIQYVCQCMGGRPGGSCDPWRPAPAERR